MLQQTSATWSRSRRVNFGTGSLGVIVGLLLLLAVPPSGHAQTAVAADAPRPSYLARSADTGNQLQVRATLTLRAVSRQLRRSVDLSIQTPGDTLRRIFAIAAQGDMVVAIRDARRVGLHALANVSQRILRSEKARLEKAWREADLRDSPEVQSIVQILNEITIAAATRSGARTTSEINRFKNAHIRDIEYAGRRHLLDQAVGRTGAVLIARGVRNPHLREAIEQLYRYGARIGDGGSADALLSEVRAGCRTVDCKHFIKAFGRRTSLIKVLSRERLSVTEREIAGQLIGDLNKAIRAAGGR